MHWKRLLIRFLSLWPPYLGAGIRVRSISPDYREIEVEMRQRWYNTNYVGVHFGGSLYAMTDPFYMLMLIENLGRDYIVWDKAASIRFKRPGRGRVHAKFQITEHQLNEIRRAADSNEKHEPVFRLEVRDESGSVVAEVEKLLYVKRKIAFSRP